MFDFDALKRIFDPINVCALFNSLHSNTMHFILDSVSQWVFTHIVSCCIPIRDEFDFSSTNAAGVYDELFADGDYNWGRKVTYVTWLKKSFGNIKGFLTLCEVMRERQQRE